MSYKNYKRGLIWDGPPHEELKLSALEMKILLKKHNALLIRNSYDFECEDPTSFWYVIKDKFESIDELSASTRSKIRRSQRLINIRIVDRQLIIDQGYEVFISSFQNHKKFTSSTISKEIFLKNIVNRNYRAEYWGCFDKANNKLIAYASNMVYDDMCDCLSLKAIPRYLTGYYPFYGLIYHMSNFYLNEIGLKYISVGARSITKYNNQSFLINKFNFRKSYCNFSIEYDFRLKILVNLLFPFRKYISNLKISALLNQEALLKRIDLEF